VCQKFAPSFDADARITLSQGLRAFCEGGALSIITPLLSTMVRSKGVGTRRAWKTKWDDGDQPAKSTPVTKKQKRLAVDDEEDMSTVDNKGFWEQWRGTSQQGRTSTSRTESFWNLKELRLVLSMMGWSTTWIIIQEQQQLIVTISAIQKERYFHLSICC
jgi:hypothetical protein